MVDDQRAARLALREVLETERRLEVLAEASTAEQALELTERLQPDIVVMDIVLPGMGGIEATRQLRAVHPETRVVGVSLHSEPSFASEIKNAGASAFVAKDEAYEELNTTILRVCGAVDG